MKRIYFTTLLISICCIMLASCQKVEESYIKTREQAPVSPAEIIEIGFSNSTLSPPKWLEDGEASVGSTVYACCRVSGVGDTATSIHIYWELPDGTRTQTETIAVNRDMYCYSEQDLALSGEYTVHCALYGKEETTSVILAQ